jgi:rare lipoprotein A
MHMPMKLELRRPGLSLLPAVLAALGLLGILGCTGSPQRTTISIGGSTVRFQPEGIASWYGPGFAGRTTANGETFDPMQITAAHAVLPFNTQVRVTDLETGRSVVVRINDRFPGTKGRVIDLSQASFARLAPLEQGLVTVRLEPLR